MTKKEKERQESLSYLREHLRPGDTLHTLLTHVSRSGMQRRIKVKQLKDSEILDFSFHVSKVLNWSMDERGIKVNGCGMDMGFQLIYSLSCQLYPKGFGCVGENCPSNDHTNGDGDYTPHGANQTLNTALKPDLSEPILDPKKWGETIVNHWHHSGGYAIRQKWL
jgi:hypothetical protein